MQSRGDATALSPPLAGNPVRVARPPPSGNSTPPAHARNMHRKAQIFLTPFTVFHIKNKTIFSVWTWRPAPPPGNAWDIPAQRIGPDP